MHISLPRVRRIAMIALGTAITALIVALYFANRDTAQATHQPANKVWASADTVEIMEKNVTSNTVQSNDHVVLQRARVKFSNPTDVRISVSAECALWTNTATIGDDDSEAKARVELWVTIDGNTVPVSNVLPEPGIGGTTGTGPNDPDNQAGRGRVVFCNRATRMKTENIESTTVPAPPAGTAPPVDPDNEDDILIRSYNRSRTANAFNWGALNVGAAYDSPANGNNIVDIVVHARLAAELSDTKTTDNNGVDSPAAKAAIGKRTLYVEPVKMANDATF